MKIRLNVTEGAAHAGVCRDTIYTACERRELKHAHVGGRRLIRMKPEWIDMWLERHALEPDHTPECDPTATQDRVVPPAPLARHTYPLEGPRNRNRSARITSRGDDHVAG